MAKRMTPDEVMGRIVRALSEFKQPYFHDCALADVKSALSGAFDRVTRKDWLKSLRDRLKQATGDAIDLELAPELPVGTLGPALGLKLVCEGSDPRYFVLVPYATPVVFKDL